MRDTGSFKELINILIEDIEYYNNAITSGQAKLERHSSLKRVILSSYLSIVQAQYSNGASKEVVKNSLLDCIPAFEESFEYVKGYGQYDEMIWLLSLSVLCEIDAEDFKKITDIIKRDKANDKLLSLIIKSKDNTWEESTISPLQTEPYASAIDLDSETKIKHYLEKVWYQGHSDAAWYNTHLNKKVNCYAGYWAWEVAAIVKINNIDDSNLRKVKYYPYDAVHW